MSQLQANVRFLLFPSGKEFTKTFPIDSTFQQVKSSLFNEWPKNLPTVSSVDELRLIHSGRIIEENQKVKDVFKITTEDNVSITVHIAIRRTPTQKPSSPIQPTEVIIPPTEEEEFHHHFCGIDEEEVNMISVIFEKKKGKDGKLLFTEVEKFLKTYWLWMRRNNFKESHQEFPNSYLLSLKTELIGENDRLSKDEFRQFFYLFDNGATEQRKCPHGEKPRVRFSAEQLHYCIAPDSEFCSDLFDNVFKTVDRDSDGILSCTELELLYYMYSANIIEH